MLTFPLPVRPTRHCACIIAVSALAIGCSDLPSRVTQPSSAPLSAVKFWEDNAATRWNARASELIVLRPPANGQAASSRILTYLSIAQYRAALAAEKSRNGSVHPSVSAAIGGASVAVLSNFFSMDVASLEAWFQTDLNESQWPGGTHEDDATGQAIGRSVGAAVLTQAATDRYLTLLPGSPPVGPGYWVSSGAPISRSMHGTRPFFLGSADRLRPPPPPAFGSPEYLAALAEVRAISDTRTPEQTALAVYWATGAGPFTAVSLNSIATEMLRAHHRTEAESARILAYANAAAFDAQIACSDAKFTYWFIRPTQADPAITLPIALPNHPSYPSAHSCITGALMTVLGREMPSERARMDAIIVEAGLSRLYGGLHYRFDLEAGQAIGRGAAELALAGSLE